MQSFKALILFFLSLTILGCATLESHIVICADNFESRECNDSKESEEKCEKSEIEKWAPQNIENIFSAAAYSIIDFEFLDIYMKDIHIEVIIPPPEIV
jgi:hypothetical protein